MCRFAKSHRPEVAGATSPGTPRMAPPPDVEVMPAEAALGATILMDLDDIAFGVVKEDLLPTVHGPGAIVREGDAALLEPPLERFNVVRPECDVAALDRVDRI